MNCQQAKSLIDLYADGELDAATSLEIEPHLAGCADCALALRNLQGMKKALKQNALYFPAPPGLLRQIKAELPTPAKVSTPSRPSRSWSWLSTILAGTAAACLALLLTVTLNRPSPAQQLAREIVSDHVRSLMAGHLMDVVSTDQHTVKPWFNGKLDFSPPVTDLVAQGFPLVGGRLDYLEGRSAAALVFQRNKHVINLFVWPAAEPAASPATVPGTQGYHLIHWSDAGMTFWAVSDLNEKELMEFAHSYASASSH